MSRLADIHQYYLDQIGSLLPSYTRLSNAYQPEENAIVLLKQGYGVTIGRAQNAKKTHSTALLVSRQFSIVMTREYLALEEDGASKATTEKALIEDAALLRANLEAGFRAGGPALRSRIAGDGGIESVGVSSQRFLKTVIDLEVEYFEEVDP